MGRRKIEIKAIKDDRNRSVTFLKRKGGLFKKAHELSVLCSVDVAVIIFGSNKKLYEYSSNDMRELIGRYSFHGGPNEHKGPNDYNGGGDDGSDDEGDGTPPPPPNEAMETHMMPPHYAGQAPPQFAQFRHNTPSASPPISNGVAFAQHAAATQAIQRGHTPQPPQGGSRPTSRNDMRRMPKNVQPPGPPQGPHQSNGYAFMPHPAIYNPQAQQIMPPAMGQPGPQYPFAPPPTTHAPPPHMQQYVDERPSSMPPSFPPHVAPGNSLPPPPQVQQRHSVSPPQAHSQQLPHQHAPPRNSPHPPNLPPPPHNAMQLQQQQQLRHEQPSPPQPPQIQEPQPPTPVEPKTEAPEWHEVKKLPQRKQYSIFTPIDENRSILSQHLAAFRSEPLKPDPSSSSGPNSKPNADNSSSTATTTTTTTTTNNNNTNNRSQSVDSGNVASRSSTTSSPPTVKAADSAVTQIPQPKSRMSISSIPETMFTPPSRQNSLRPGGPLRPRLRVEIPPDGSEDNSATGTGGSASSPRNGGDAGPLGTRRNGETHTGIVLPPPSPSASAILSAGASGPPNPFARPIPHQNNNSNSNNNSMHIDTPGSALPSRFMNSELLPSPSSFYPEWGFGRGSDSATLPSPLNFATPVVGTGPSFLRDDHLTSNKRKSPEASAGAPSSDPIDHSNEPKRVKVDS
ncbi:resistance to lethality of mkk1p386 overexpression [Sporothrix curviconia]|uniref:Resistance to lethality of mkk1p386 overexpression n=1 Tax=Sporothrix curviconia TaxID=1260050 RepID=A0ABP0B7L5_9PEZI